MTDDMQEKARALATRLTGARSDLNYLNARIRSRVKSSTSFPRTGRDEEDI